MSTLRAKPLLFVLLLLTCSIAGNAAESTQVGASASTTGDPMLRRAVVGSGGGDSAGGPYRIRGTSGETGADPLGPISGGSYRLQGAFWAAGGAVPSDLFSNGFEEQP